MLIDGKKALTPGGTVSLATTDTFVDWLVLQAGTASHATVIFVVGSDARETSRSGIAPSSAWGTSLERPSRFFKGPLNLKNVQVGVEPQGQTGSLTWLAMRKE